MKNKKRVLIVDDDINITSPVAASLGMLGDEYIIEAVNDSVEALRKIKSEFYDLVLTDYQMPKISGVVLAQQIHKSSPDTQVIMMTGHSSTGLQDVVGSLKLDGYIEKPVRLSRVREIVQEALERTMEGDDAFRSGERTAAASVAKPLQELRVNTGARCILLLSDGGYPIEIAGETGTLDVSSISALVAANFMATAELAKLLGDSSVFKSSYHEGPDYNIFAYRINEDALLAVIFGSESKSGIVRYYTSKAVDEILPLLGALDEVPEGFHLEDDFSDAVGDEIDNLFG